MAKRPKSPAGQRPASRGGAGGQRPPAQLHPLFFSIFTALTLTTLTTLTSLLLLLIGPPQGRAIGRWGWCIRRLAPRRLTVLPCFPFLCLRVRERERERLRDSEIERLRDIEREREREKETFYFFTGSCFFLRCIIAIKQRYLF